MIAFRSDITLSKAALIRWRDLPEGETGCAWWMTPEAKWRDDAGEAAEDGTLVHAPLAALSCGGVLEIPEKPIVRALFAKGRTWLLENKIPGSPLTFAERVFAYDVATGKGRELVEPPGKEGCRWYADPEKRAKHGVKPTEICTRVDLALRGCDAHGFWAWIIDFKTHQSPEATTARAQLEDCARAVTAAWGIDRAIATGVHLWADRETWEENFSLGPEELRGIGARLAQNLTVPANVPATPGPHCEAYYCPARGTCPATVAAVEEAMHVIPVERLPRGPAPGVTYPLMEPATTNEHFAWKLDLIPLLEAAVAVLKDEVKAGADALDGIRRPGGGIYSGKTHIEENVDLAVPGARELLEAHGLDLAIDTTPRTTWSAIQLASGSEAAQKAIRKELREKVPGAVRGTPVTVYKTRGGPAKAKTPRAKGNKATA